MNHLTLIGAALKHRKGRTVFTWLSVLVAFILFSILAAVHYGMTGSLEITSAERLDTFDLVTQGGPMPVSYYDKIIAVPGVTAAIYLNRLPGYFKDPKHQLLVLATNARSVTQVYPEFTLSPARVQTWRRDRQGAIAGPELASRMGWKVGETIPVRSEVPQKGGGTTWYFHLDGIYHAKLPSFYQNLFVAHYQYINEGVADTRLQNVASEITERIGDARNATRIGSAIDALFASSPVQTLTQPQTQLILSYLRQIGNVTAIAVYVGIAVFFSLLLIVGNSFAQSLRERTPDLAMLRALGFKRRGVAWLVLEEALLLIVSAGLVGMLVGWLITLALYPKVGNYLTTFQMTWDAFGTGVALTIVLAILASLVPLRRITRLRVATALRKP